FDENPNRAVRNNHQLRWSTGDRECRDSTLHAWRRPVDGRPLRPAEYEKTENWEFRPSADPEFLLEEEDLSQREGRWNVEHGLAVSTSTGFHCKRRQARLRMRATSGPVARRKERPVQQRKLFSAMPAVCRPYAAWANLT